MNPQQSTEQQPVDQQPVNSPPPYQPPAAQPTPPIYQAQQPQTTVPSHDPGKVLGIVGFIFAFVFLQLIGLPLSIVGYIKSQKAGFKNPLALAGIILNSVFLLAGIAMIAITATAYQGVQVRANSASAQSAATSVIKQSELFDAMNLVYPQTKADLPTSSSFELSSQPITSEPSTPSTVAFYACGDMTGNKVVYWDYVTNHTAEIYSGTVDASTNCTFAKE